MEERRFLRREWLVINHSVSLDVTLSLRAAQETIPESKNRAYPSPLLCKKLETYKPAKNSLYACTVFFRAARSTCLAQPEQKTSPKRRGRGGGRERRRSKASRGRRDPRAEKAQFIKICSSRR